MIWITLLIVIIFIIALYCLDRPYVYPLTLDGNDTSYYLLNNNNILGKTTISDASKHFIDLYSPTKNELILYQLQADMDEQETKDFEKVFAKIREGKD